MSEALPIPAFDQKLKSSHYISGQGPKSDGWILIRQLHKNIAKIFHLIQYFIEMDTSNRIVSSITVDAYGL